MIFYPSGFEEPEFYWGSKEPEFLLMAPKSLLLLLPAPKSLLLLPAPKNDSWRKKEGKEEEKEIHNILFKHDGDKVWVEIDHRESVEKIYCSIQKILKDLQMVESKGFLNHTNLQRFLIIKDFLGKFTDKPKYLYGSEVSESYKWIYNIIMVILYEVGMKHMYKVELDNNLQGNLDLRADYEILTKTIFGKIDPSIRQKLQKRGISIIQNIYTGFDTEYKNIDAKRNKLLSVQLAISTKTLLKIPKYSRYNISRQNPLTSEVYKIKRGDKKEKEFNYGMVEESLNRSIKEIRSLRYINNDRSIEILIEGLKGLEIPYIDKEDYYIFSFPRSPIQPFIYYDEGKGYTLKEMIKESNSVGEPYLEDSYERLIDLLRGISKDVYNKEEEKREWKENSKDPQILGVKNLSEVINKEGNQTLENNKIKKMSRVYMSSFTGDRVSVTRIRNNYIIAHLTTADLSMLDDFEEIKDELNIVNKCFVTMGKPLIYEDTNIIIRDTSLLAPAGKKSLEAIGSLYGPAFRKVSLTKTQKGNMDILLKEDKALFETYAVNDAIITLIHAIHMEDFNFHLKEVGIPITLSSLGVKYVKENWRKREYGGYQISPLYKLGDSSTVQTPKGLFKIGKTGLKLSYYISNYKGGRNESFMYGVDNETIWIDYDITSAYTTVMAGLGNPSYKEGRVISESELGRMSYEEILYSYIIIKATFEFDKSVKYPSIPCYLDETTTVYPLKGECILTGAEYLLAKIEQKCSLKIHEIYYIPFETIGILDESGKKTIRIPVNHPFKPLVKEIQEKRREHPKGSINNLLYKEMGNSVYGHVVRGMSDKRKYDIKSGKTIRMEAGELSNPVIASWITGFMRSIIGECLHKISKIGGKIVSVTTDGFITDIDDLERKLLDGNKSLLKEFKKLRKELSGNDVGLEIKNSGKGIISWTTRGQLGKEGNIKATTGFQARNYTLSELDVLFKELLKGESKTLEYVQSSLRSALEIYREGGHVTMTYKDQIFRLHYDNRRIIEEPKELEESVNYSSILLDSKPVPDIEYCRNLRSLSKLHKQRLYNRQSSILTGNKYKNNTELAIRNFIKGVLSNPPKYNLERNLSYSEIIDFIKEYDSKVKISKQSISNLKNRKNMFKTVPRSKESLNFVEYVKTKFKNFDEESYFNNP